MAGFRNPLWRFTLAAAALALLVVTSGQARAGQKYTYSTFDVPGALGNTYASGINNSGQVVGYYYDASYYPHGFLKVESVYTTINVPGSSQTFAYGINDSGQIVGYSQRGASQTNGGFLMTGSAFSSITVPGAIFATPIGINNSGQVAGLCYDASGINGFLMVGSDFTPITVPGKSYTRPSGINISGQIVGSYYDNTEGGYHGFLKAGSGFTPITVPGASDTEASGINDSGQIVGTYFVTGVTRGFLMAGSAFTSINVPGAAGTYSTGINNSGQIVGYYFDATGNHGFIATLTIEGILDFLDQSVAAGTLYGTGPPSVAPVRLQAFGGSLKLVKAVLDHGDEPSARRLLKGALQWCDGVPSPPDFVAGPAAPGLAAMIQNLMAEMVGM